MIEIKQGSALDVLQTMPDESVHCIVTSPPYWGLRSYGTDPQVWANGHELCAVHEWLTDYRKGEIWNAGKALSHGGTKQRNRKDNPDQWQKVAYPVDTCTRCGAWRGELGLEPTPELYVEHIVKIFREARRVLRDDGTCWVNIGDSYGATSNRNGLSNSSLAKGEMTRAKNGTFDITTGLKPKNLCGIPWRVAFALQADGWYLRQDIIWHKPNPMPESVKDRCTKAHEYVFLLTKRARYFYDADAIREEASDSGWNRQRASGNPHKRKTQSFDTRNADSGTSIDIGEEYTSRNRRSVWSITTKPFNGAKAMADYVDEHGTPYTASPDCPIHGHLARYQTSDILSGDALPTENENHISGSDGGHGQESFYESKSKNGHNRAATLGENAHAKTLESNHGNKTLVGQNEQSEGEQSLDHNLHRSMSVEVLGDKLDYSRQANSLLAKPHSKQKNKTDHVLPIAQRDNVSAQTLFDTQSIESPDALYDSADHTHENNILIDDSSVHLSADTGIHSVGKFSHDTSAPIICKCKKVSIDHFATFPPKLIEPMILAGTSEKGVCSKCGAPWERVTEHIKGEHNARGSEYQREKSEGVQTGGLHSTTLSGIPGINITIGWHPTCECDAEVVPATVMDLFNGAGTTGLVALQHNRNYIGIELKPEYIEMTQARLAKAQPLLV